MEFFMHSTNYRNVFIEVAEDCPAVKSEIPPQNDNVKTIARLHYEMLIDAPYKYTSDDILFKVYAVRNKIPVCKYIKEREVFFSKGQACMRSSPLTKRYGWGIHADQNQKIAIFPIESEEYKKLASDLTIEHKKAMRNKRG
jgi:hypothetical protein